MMVAPKVVLCKLPTIFRSEIRDGDVSNMRANRAGVLRDKESYVSYLSERI